MSDYNTPNKQCTICQEWKPATAEYFYGGKRYKDGLYGYCKACHRQKSKQYVAVMRKRPKKPVATKRCSSCKIEKPATPEYFYSRPESQDGFRGNCRDCSIAQSRQWQLANPERVRENARNRMTNYRKRNREKVLERTRKWKAANKDKTREYRDKNHANFAVYSARRKTRTSELPHEFTNDDWQFAVDYFNGRCAVCERALNGFFHKAHADHWIPINDPNCPGSVPHNVIPLCGGVGGCNNSKGDKPPHEWLKQKYGAKKARAIGNRIHRFFSSVRRVN